MYVIKLKNILLIFAALAVVIIGGATARAVVQTAADSKEYAHVPILMYHSILKNNNGSKYIVSPSALENDLKFLQDNGYTTILIQDLIDYVYNGAELPEKPVVLTFDDGCYNNYVYVYPLLKKYNAKAVISIVGEYTDRYSDKPDPNPNYEYLSWDEATELMESGYIEIQNHTYNLHSMNKGRSGCKKKRGESAEQYEQLLNSDIGLLQQKCEQHLGKAPTAFTYPFGSVSTASYDIIRSLGFKASLSCEEGVNELDRSPEKLYMLKRYIRTPSRRAEDILK